MGEVLKLNGERFFLKESLKKAVQVLKKDGCLIFKKATNLIILPVGIIFMDSVKAEIALNKVKLSDDLFIEKQD